MRYTAWGALAGTDTSAVHILAQAPAQDAVAAALLRARNDARRQGVGLWWTTEGIRPGAGPTTNRATT